MTHLESVSVEVDISGEKLGDYNCSRKSIYGRADLSSIPHLDSLPGMSPPVP